MTPRVALRGDLLTSWLAVDRRNIVRALLGVPYVEGIKQWATNDFASTVVLLKRLLRWSTSRDSVVELVRGYLEPIAINLGVHLQLAR